MLLKVIVNDKGFNNDNGYQTICDQYDIGTVVTTAVKNGHKDIEIWEPSCEEKIEYRRLNSFNPIEGEF